MPTQRWRQKILDAVPKVVQQIRWGYLPQKIVLFGSVARGDFHEDSDIDLLVIKETETPFLDRIGQVLDVIDVPVSVEPVVYTPEEWDRLLNEGRDFALTIYHEGGVLYERACEQQSARSEAVVEDGSPGRWT